LRIEKIQIFEDVKDKQKLEKKLKQLPDKGLGLLINYDYHLGINVLPEWVEQMPENKAVAELLHVDYGNGVQSEARLYFNSDFNHYKEAEKLLNALGFSVKPVTFKV